MRNPFIAGFLSLLIPGLGQIYNGRIIFGLIWMLVFGISWIGSVGFFGLIVHVISAWCAYSYAKDHPVRVKFGLVFKNHKGVSHSHLALARWYAEAEIGEPF